MIEWLRQRMGFWVAAAIFIALLLFVLGDFLTRYQWFLEKKVLSIAEIKGNTITREDFEKEVDFILIKRYKTTEVPENERMRIREELWLKKIYENVYKPELEALDITLPPDELRDVFYSSEPHPVILNFFTDPVSGRVLPQILDDRGNYSPEKLRAFLNLITQQNPQSDFIQRMEENLTYEITLGKYINLITNSVYFSTKEATWEHIASSMAHTYLLLKIPYNKIPDNYIKADEASLNKFYMDKGYGPAYFNDEDAKDLFYVFFDVKPTAKDSMLIKDSLLKIRSEWISDISKKSKTYSDSEIVRSFGGSIFLMSKNDLLLVPDSVILSISEDSVSLPYLDEGKYSVAKTISTKIAPDSVKARHILLTYERDSASVERLADSLLSLLINKRVSFDTLALNFSKDPGSYNKGGDLGWFKEGTFIQPLSDSCFMKNKGDIFKVYSQFGIHIVEIMDKTPPVKKFIVGKISLPIIPSSHTRDSIYGIVSRFYSTILSANQDFKIFVEEGKKFNGRYFPSFTLKTTFLPGIALNPEIKYWIYTSGLHSISKPYELPEGYLIIGIEKETKKGRKTFYEIYSTLKDEYIKFSKFKYVLNNTPSNLPLEEIAKRWNATIDTITDLSFSALSIPGVGYEPKVIGAPFHLEPGQESPFIRGEDAIYKLKIISRKDYEPPNNLIINQIKKQKISTYKAIVENQFDKILYHHYQLKDYRNLHY